MRWWNARGAVSFIAVVGPFALAGCVEADFVVAPSEAGTDSADAPVGDGSPSDSDADTGSACRDPAGHGASPCESGACSITALISPPPAGPAQFAFGMTLDATHVYWTTQSLYNGKAVGTVRRSRKDGMGPAEPMALNQSGPVDVAVDSKYVYWLNDGVVAGDMARVWRVRKDAPCAEDACSSPEQVYAGKIADPVDLLGLGEEDLFIVGSNEQLRHHKASVWSSSVAWATGDYPTATFDSRWIYASNAEQPIVHRISRDGAGRTLFGTYNQSSDAALAGAAILVNDCSAVYAYGGTLREVARLDKSTGLRTLVKALPAGIDVYGAAVDDTFLYFAAANGGGVRRMRKDNPNNFVSLAGGNVWRVKVDDDSVFWAEHTTGVVFRLTK